MQLSLKMGKAALKWPWDSRHARWKGTEKDILEFASLTPIPMLLQYFLLSTALPARSLYPYLARAAAFLLPEVQNSASKLYRACESLGISLNYSF